MTEDVVIRAEGLGKRYIVGHAEREHYVALRDVVVRGARKAWRNTADMIRGRPIVVGDTTEDFWALRDIDFEVKRGEVLGIIGSNGAGKSTLLKILSRITEPTEGRATIKGRIASLIEVGTGFHLELTGRENIFLNGAILGMTGAEVRRKLDEIVAFSGVENFLDTPVKRYSSGMYLRLAFAVAAHLEPEILLIDEVLAVGDMEFQKKCLGKMSQVASSGRTVLFVSHNLAAVESLCSWCIGLQGGRIFARGRPADVLDSYLGQRQTIKGRVDLSAIKDREGSGGLRFASVWLVDNRGAVLDRPRAGQTVHIYLRFSGDNGHKSARVSVVFSIARTSMPLFICDTETAGGGNIAIGDSDTLRLTIPELPLSAGTYKMIFFLECSGVVEDWIRDLEIEVADEDFFGSGKNTPVGYEGQVVLVRNSWELARRRVSPETLV